MDELAFNVEIISTQNIKPSTPTPIHLKHLPLTRFDQLLSSLQYSTPLVLFYASTTSNHLHLHRLKQSLSTTLSFFYPLAGRLSHDLTTILCNDHGVPFIVAQTKTKTTLSTFLSHHNRLELLPHFLPPKQLFRSSSGWVPLVIKLTLFNCGGIAIGTHVLHKAYIDGITRDHFFKTWAAINAGHFNHVITPDFTLALSLFPPCAGPTGDSNPKVLGPLDNEGESCIVKPFYFSPRSIKALQSMARTDSLPNPTRVETVSAFLWKHLMAAAVTVAVSSAAFLEKESKRKESVVIHSVNMRPYINPAAPPQASGKFTTHAIVECNNVGNGSIPSIVELVRMIRKVFSDTKDMKFVSKFIGEQGEEATRRHKQKMWELKHDPSKITYTFASWSGLDLDFGLGMPVWVGFMGGKVNRWFRNFVPLINVPGDGIEAWLVLDEEEMAKLESDLEFLAYASPSTGTIYSPNSSL